jgi:PAS domain S-box-containing protein
MDHSTTQTAATILLVDDNPANLSVLTQLLTAHGFRILVAKQGESGLQIAQRAQPDLILLDVQLPEMDGFTMCRSLKADARTADIPVLFMTVRMESEDKIKGFAAGAVDYITKPFQAEEALARITTHLRLRQLAHSLQEQNVQLQAAESALRQANEDLERRVRERTAELVAERNLLRTLIDALPDQIYVKDTQSRFILANTATMQRLKVSTLGQLLGKTDFDYFPPELAAQYYADEQAILRSGRPMLNQEELGVDRETGAETWNLSSKVPVRDMHGAVNGLVGIGHDITARKRAEQQLRANEEQLRIGAQRLQMLYAAEQHARRSAEILRAANLALTQTLDLDTILDTLLEYLEQLVPYDSASAMVYEADARIVVRSVRGEARWGDLHLVREMVLEVASFPHLQALLANQASILVASTAAAPFWKAHDGASQTGSWLGVPLIAGGLVIGLYALDKRQPDFFTDEHRQIAESLAAQAAVAMQNAYLFGEMSAARTRLQVVSRQLVVVQEAERAQIARDLHDEIGQMLTGLKLTLAIGVRSTHEMTQARLAEAQELVNDLTTRVRELSLDLRPAMLDDLGLLPTLLWYIKRYTAQTEIQVLMKHTGLEQRLASDVEIAVYRIVQEGLTNVARHAGVREVALWIWRREDTIRLQIEDQGRGFMPEQVLTAHASSGLVGMVERVRLLGGQLTIESTPGQGTLLAAELPLGAALE